MTTSRGGRSLGAALMLALAAATSPAGARAQATKQAPPAPLPARPLAFPAYRETALANGLKLIVVERHDLPVADVSLYVRAGNSADPAGQAGLAALVAELVTKGTATRSAREIAVQVEGAGGSLNSFATGDYAGIDCSILAEKLPLAFEVVSDAARRASFPADELETARKRMVSSLQMEQSQPAAVARRILNAKLYGAASPYGVSSTKASLQALTAEQVKAFYAARYRGANALLVVAGDVTPAKAQALARQYFGDWAGGAPAAVTLPAAPAYGKLQLFLVNRPGSVQSNILVGTTTAGPASPDYRGLEVGSHVLGGGTDSRLFQILREQKSWTYGAYANLRRPRLLGALVANTEVRTSVTDSALVEMLKQIRRLADEPVSAADLTAARGYLAGSFPLKLQRSADIARQIAELRLLGLPVTELTQYPEKIDAVSAAQIQQAARRYLDPKRLVVVVVGDAPKLMPALEKLGPVTLLDIEGQPLDAAALEVRASQIPLDGSQLKPMTATYDVKLQGNPLGTTTLTLARDGDAWVAKSVLTSAMFSQQEELRMKATDLTPLSVSQSTTAGGVTYNSDLKLEGGKITGTAALPPQAGGNKTFDLPVPAGTLLPGEDEFALAVLPLEVGRTITLPGFSVQSGSVVNTSFKIAAEEKVTVAGGTFDAYRVEATGEVARTIWLRKELPHVQLKSELTMPPITTELKSIQ